MGASCHTDSSVCVSPVFISRDTSENMNTPNEPPKSPCKQAGPCCSAALEMIVAYVMPTDKMRCRLSHRGKDSRGPATQGDVLAVLNYEKKILQSNRITWRFSMKHLQ